MKIDFSPSRNAYLFFAVNSQDEARLDEYAAQKEIEYTKIGERTYIGLFDTDIEATYAQLKEKLHLSDLILWVRLGPTEITPQNI